MNDVSVVTQLSDTCSYVHDSKLSHCKLPSQHITTA